MFERVQPIGLFLASLSNIKLITRDLPGTNAPAYFDVTTMDRRKSLIAYQLFLSILNPCHGLILMLQNFLIV
jgi:hypothetical protein